MKYQISSISILQTSKIVAILYAVMGLCFIPVSCLTLYYGADDPSMMMLGIFYLLAPLGYALIGFIAVAIGSWIYNIVASRAGGVEFSMEEMPETHLS